MPPASRRRARDGKTAVCRLLLYIIHDLIDSLFHQSVDLEARINERCRPREDLFLQGPLTRTGDGQGRAIDTEPHDCGLAYLVARPRAATICRETHYAECIVSASCCGEFPGVRRAVPATSDR